MYSSIQELPVQLEIPEGILRQISWGHMTVEYGQVKTDFVPELALKESPKHNCQCPHWGYVIKGRMRLKYPDREEVFQAGDVYYAVPSHITYYDAGCEYIEFSPTLEYNQKKVAVREYAEVQK